MSEIGVLNANSKKVALQINRLYINT